MGQNRSGRYTESGRSDRSLPVSSNALGSGAVPTTHPLSAEFAKLADQALESAQSTFCQPVRPISDHGATKGGHVHFLQRTKRLRSGLPAPAVKPGLGSSAFTTIEGTRSDACMATLTLISGLRVAGLLMNGVPLQGRCPPQKG